ncbi:MAG: DUF2378 family protein [Polyangiaceae bacterium]|nr:DUF2378 family protein [Polyangiaceae bacterium]
MPINSSVRDLVASCDLEERIALVPASAMLRGLYFKNTLNILRRAGRERPFVDLYPEKYSAVHLYPVTQFLERLAVAGALLAGPQNVHQGMQEIGLGNARAFSGSLLGKSLLKFLAPNPVKLLKQADAGRRLSCTYGRWHTDFIETNRAVVHLYEEYLWIESNILGAAIGTFDSIGKSVQVDVELISRFEGRLFISWDS